MLIRLLTLIRKNALGQLSHSNHRILSTAIFIIPAALTAFSFDLNGRTNTWIYIRIPVLFALTLIIFFRSKGQIPFLAHLCFYIIFSYYAVQCMYPYADRYLQYDINKCIDIFSPFSGRHLYSAYRASEFIASSDHFSLAYKYWEFPYLPLASLPGLYGFAFNFHPAIPLLIIQALVAYGLYYFNSDLVSQLASSIVLLSPLPLLFMNAFYLNNAILIPFGFLVMFFGYMIRRRNPILSGILLGFAALFLQTMLIIWAFALIVFYREQAFKTIFISLFVLLLVMGFFVCHDFEASFNNIVTANAPSYLDYHLYLAGRPIKIFSMIGILTNAFHISSDWLVEHFPGTQLAAFICVSFWLVAALRKFSAKTTLQLGSLAFIAMVFTMKYSCALPHYYLAPVLTLLIRDGKNRIDLDPPLSPRRTQIIFTFVAVLHICLFGWIYMRLSDAYDFPVGSQKSFCLGNFVQNNCHILDPEKSMTPVPEHRLIAGRDWGWVNSQFGHQFHILTPPGKYITRICSSDDHCREWSDDVVANKSLGLRIPFLIELMGKSSYVVVKGNPSDIGIRNNDCRIENAKFLSIYRSE